MIIFACSFFTSLTLVTETLDSLYSLLQNHDNIVHRSFRVLILHIILWIFRSPFLVSIYPLCYGITVQCGKDDGNRSWLVTTYFTWRNEKAIDVKTNLCNFLVTSCP